MKTLLLLSNIQLLALFILLPILAIIFISVFSSFMPDIIVLMFMPLLLIIWLGIYLGWHYAAGTSLYRLSHKTSGISLTIFKVSICCIGLYIIIGSLREFLPSEDNGIGTIITILYRLASVGLIYNAAFIAKTLNTYEQGRQSTAREWILDMIFIIFFPVGIYLIQPRINEIFKSSASSHTNPINLT